MPTTKTAEVIADAYTWLTPVDGKPDAPAHHRAWRGDQIEVSPEEFDRGAELGALAEPSVAEVAQAERDALDTGSYTDEELAGLSAEELVAYVGQHPNDARRVYDLETTRKADRQRKTVLAAVTAALEDEAGGGPDVLVTGGVVPQVTDTPPGQ